MPTVFTPTVLYMLVTAASPQWDRVNARTISHPWESKRQDRHGLTILHVALCRNAPLSTLTVLLDAYPDAARCIGNTGQNPLSVACWRRPSLEVMKLLLDSYPEGVFVADRSGCYPADALWRSYGMNHIGGEKGLIENIQNGIFDGEVKDFWESMVFMFRHWYLRGDGTENEQRCFRILHAAMEVPCPIPLIAILISRYTEQLTERDEEGRTPLLIAIRPFTLASPTGDGQQLLYDDDYRQKSIINMILASSPPVTARTRDDKGRYPLIVAIEAGLTWRRGLGVLIDAAPDVLRVRDVTTGLYPFMVAAVVSDLDVEDLYELICHTPELIMLGTH